MKTVNQMWKSYGLKAIRKGKRKEHQGQFEELEYFLQSRGEEKEQKEYGREIFLRKIFRELFDIEIKNPEIFRKKLGLDVDERFIDDDYFKASGFYFSGPTGSIAFKGPEDKVFTEEKYQRLAALIDKSYTLKIKFQPEQTKEKIDEYIETIEYYLWVEIEKEFNRLLEEEILPVLANHWKEKRESVK